LSGELPAGNRLLKNAESSGRDLFGRCGRGINSVAVKFCQNGIQPGRQIRLETLNGQGSTDDRYEK
jgi:hypothetical protein